MLRQRRLQHGACVLREVGTQLQAASIEAAFAEDAPEHFAVLVEQVRPEARHLPRAVVERTARRVGVPVQEPAHQLSLVAGELRRVRPARVAQRPVHILLRAPDEAGEAGRLEVEADLDVQAHLGRPQVADLRAVQVDRRRAQEEHVVEEADQHVPADRAAQHLLRGELAERREPAARGHVRVGGAALMEHHQAVRVEPLHQLALDVAEGGCRGRLLGDGRMERRLRTAPQPRLLLHVLVGREQHVLLPAPRRGGFFDEVAAVHHVAEQVSLPGFLHRKQARQVHERRPLRIHRLRSQAEDGRAVRDQVHVLSALEHASQHGARLQSVTLHVAQVLAKEDELVTVQVGVEAGHIVAAVVLPGANHCHHLFTGELGRSQE